ncbi:MAG: capsule assembly Wzi family protein [Treponema sp.]|jgi:hypothetical protein|nr:capsule assembly Wzi family protein [Treponema sp.]
MILKRYGLGLVLFFLVSILYAQEALKSSAEEYYDFLSLRGISGRPTLNYRTLSDSVWHISGEAAHPWEDNSFDRRFAPFGPLNLRMYGPEFFMSVNTAAPYGQNDGALWQGRGFNASLTGGIRLEFYGLEATFKPQAAFSQNAAFDILKPEMSDSKFAGKGDTYGYFWSIIDAPQRFGGKAFFTWDWGDTEIRYTWKTFTLGFGTQTVWLGPAYLNPILHSNNAPSYPKIDMGLRRQRLVLPWLHWYLGDIESRIWIGRLTESPYFDNDESNDHTMYHGFSFAYAPSFLPGLTISFNRVCLAPWEFNSLKYIAASGQAENTAAEDQKGSMGMDWIFSGAGLEIYGELGIDDFVPGRIKGYIRYPFHTMVYTAGIKKTLNILPGKGLYGQIIFEWNNREMSQDFQFQWPASFYSHGSGISYTQKGQILGAGTGWAGNSQFLMLRIFYPKGASSVFIHRSNPDNNFVYSQAIYTSADSEKERKYFTGFRSDLTTGLNAQYFLKGNISIGGGAAYTFIVNPYYFYSDPAGTSFKEWNDVYGHNFSFSFTVKYSL